MGSIIDIVSRIKARLTEKKQAGEPRADQAFYDTASDGDEASTGNPIVDLYNRAVTHPATTIGLLAAGIGVAAAIAFVMAEKQAQKGIDRELERKGRRAAKKLRSWGEDEIMPRVKEYRRYKRKWRD